MKVLRTPDKYFTNIKGYPFDPIYTDIFADDGTEIRIHHIDEGLHRYDVSLFQFHHLQKYLYILDRKGNP